MNKSINDGTRKLELITQVVPSLLILLFIVTSSLAQQVPQPSGPDNITNVSTETATPASAYLLNTSGGTVSTIVLNGTTQTPRWKAYVGNVTGSLALANNIGLSVYDWEITSAAGEVYATRSSETVDWLNIGCANSTHVTNEETAINITSSNPDSISNTFTSANHTAFYAGVNNISANICPSIYTNVNGTAQANSFEELLLYDGTNLTHGDIVYTTIVEDAIQGFDNQYYNFQLIVPESGLEGIQPNTAYYFYVELI